MANGASRTPMTAAEATPPIQSSPLVEGIRMSDMRVSVIVRYDED